jgi:hypothetical protein
MAMTTRDGSFPGSTLISLKRIRGSQEDKERSTSRWINALVAEVFELVSGPDKVRQAIWLILETEPGERLMRPAFGCGLRRYLMKPNTSAGCIHGNTTNQIVTNLLV